MNGIGSFESDGIAIIESAIRLGAVQQIVSAIEARQGVASAGLRQPHIEIEEIGALVVSKEMRRLVESVVPPEARVVRSILFDKTAERNWGVPWHQDLTIAVAERREAPGFVGWSVKDGVHCVQAPREVLERMLTMRLHLDDCGAENGPLRVLPGTHRDGWLDTEAIERFKCEIPERVCVVRRGGAVLMRPLLLHASSRAVKPGHRRVLHLEFAAGELPRGLRFFAT